ncbi:MAG: Holliday junction resolvase RuvX [Candidatus Nomurabacteria bacterium]|jgi:putative Holliday junction resolvase|nr:Holliday junction resolvase RuvX [Candidatus Nomurabacteria bacterium]
MTEIERAVALAVGEKRIGVAFGDSQTKITVPAATLANDDQFTENFKQLIDKKNPVAIVIGLPRNSKGQETQQSKYVRNFAESLKVFNLPIIFQDESLTTIEAEMLLNLQHVAKQQNRGQVDSKAAALILSDYLEQKYGR